MATSYFCQEKQEIALINAEDKSQSEKARADWARAARMWEELSDRWLELELRQGLIPHVSAK